MYITSNVKRGDSPRSAYVVLYIMGRINGRSTSCRQDLYLTMYNCVRSYSVSLLVFFVSSHGVLCTSTSGLSSATFFGWKTLQRAVAAPVASWAGDVVHEDQHHKKKRRGISGKMLLAGAQNVVRCTIPDMYSGIYYADM